MKLILVAAAAGGMVFSPAPGLPEYQKGWCDGYNYAADAVMHNRDVYRRLLGRPQMSHEQVIDWIYSRPWKDAEGHRTSPRRLDQPPGIPEVGPDAIESVDLYVVLPAKCEIPSS